jgi:hypothetical protein
LSEEDLGPTVVVQRPVTIGRIEQRHAGVTDVPVRRVDVRIVRPGVVIVQQTVPPTPRPATDTTDRQIVVPAVDRNPADTNTTAVTVTPT